MSPLAALIAATTARRMAWPGWEAPVPVLCVGNAGLGGAGKTTVVLDLVRRLRARGVAVHCLTRGYGGTARGVLRVDPSAHDHRIVGDEPLLLAAAAPTWVGADRAATGRAAVEAGAGLLLMDDGLQNPSLAKTASLLVIDGAVGFGNGRVIPAGPLREPAWAAAARCRAAVLIGGDQHGTAQEVPDLPILRADLAPEWRLDGMRLDGMRLDGMRLFAFTGIARPAKFHASLRAAGADLAGTADFADHHAFTPRELQSVLTRAADLGARAATTPKDAVRLPPAVRALVEVVGVSLVWEDGDAVERLLSELLTSAGGPGLLRSSP